MKTKVWTRGLKRPKRALYLSSPIGLGHARRDVAVAKELKRLRPSSRSTGSRSIRSPRCSKPRVNTSTRRVGGSPTSRRTSPRSASEHDLHCFQALRRMDEILVANFMVFQEVVEEGCYDVVIGDEAWDVDHFWHENPELKRGQHVWLTDFVGFLPMPDGGEHEAFLTTDYNAEMIEHVARYPWIRDRAIFVGNPDDIVADSFGAQLPAIRDWTEEHFSFSGYITGFTPPTRRRAPSVACRARLWRRRAGLRRRGRWQRRRRGAARQGDRRLPVGEAAAPGAADGGRRWTAHRPGRVPDTSRPRGPRLRRPPLPPPVRLRPRRRARRAEHRRWSSPPPSVRSCTSRSRHHFEQNFHVRHRLDRYGAGRCMDYATTDPDLLAAAIVESIGQPANYRDVELDGAARAAQLIADLI